MAITPRDVRNQRFTEARRGYASEEVRAFQERVADALKAYEAEVAKLQARIQASEERVKEMRDIEEAVKRTFAAATRTKREMLTEAEADAARLRREAERDAEQARAALDDEERARRSAAEAQAAAIVGEATAAADAQRAAANAEVQAMDRRLAQLRTSVRDLEARLRQFATSALDELAVATDLIDLETVDISEIDHLTPGVAEAAGEAALDGTTVPEEVPAAAPEGEPDAGEAEERPGEAVASAAAAGDEPLAAEAAGEPAPASEAAATHPATAVEPEPARTVGAAGPDETEAPAGLAVGIPVDDVAEPVPAADDEPEGGFYERRLAGLRRRIEAAGDS